MTPHMLPLIRHECLQLRSHAVGWMHSGYVPAAAANALSWCPPAHTSILWLQEYGKVRLWGAIGWGIVSAIAGGVVSTYGLVYGFVMQFALSIPVVVIALGMDFGRASSLTGAKVSALQQEPSAPSASSCALSPLHKCTS